MRLSCLTPRRRPVNPARANVPRRGGIERSAKNLNGFAPAGRPEVGRARVSGALSFRLRLVAVSPRVRPGFWRNDYEEIIYSFHGAHSRRRRLARRFSRAGGRAVEAGK